MKTLSTSARLAWLALGINLVTVLGGTLVRATGSGAGCGQSWPTCHGSLLPGMAALNTRIEYAHRAFSGMALLSVLALFIHVYRSFAKGSPERRVVNLSALAIIIESLLGAWLVLARLVEENSSVMRAISVPVHLVNTLFLLAALTASAWVLSEGQAFPWRGPGRKKLLAAAIGLILLGATGAIAALADTLFPAESLHAGLVADLDESAHFLTRLRMVHPIVAVLMSGFLMTLAASIHEGAPRHAKLIISLVLLQLCLGLANVLLLTPVAIQIAHLLVADLIWISLVLASATLGSRAATPAD